MAGTRTDDRIMYCDLKDGVKAPRMAALALAAKYPERIDNWIHGREFVYEF